LGGFTGKRNKRAVIKLASKEEFGKEIQRNKEEREIRWLRPEGRVAGGIKRHVP